jgi:hypothetical protein
MANELQTLSWLVGGAVVIGLGYFAYTKGLFDQAFDLVNNAIKGSGTPAKEEETPAEAEPAPAPASKCKSGELESSKGKCVKCATSLDSKDKCAKAALALSYMGSARSPYASHSYYAVVS